MEQVGSFCELELLFLYLELQYAFGMMELDQLDNACFNSGIRNSVGGMHGSSPGAPLVLVVCKQPKFHPEK